MAMSGRWRGGKTLDSEATLPCGRTVDGLWEQVRSGGTGDAHTQSCPHCLTTLDGLSALRVATRALVAEDVAAPPSLLDRVMRVVRTEARRGATVVLFGGPDSAVVSIRAIAGLVRFVVDSRRELYPVHVRVTNGSEFGLVDVAVRAEVLGELSAISGTVERELRESLAAVLGGGLGLGLGRLRVQVRQRSDG
jgi:hypothetical protein